MRKRISRRIAIVVSAWMVAMHALVSCAGETGGRQSEASNGWPGDAATNVGDGASNLTEGGIGADGGAPSGDAATMPDAGSPTCDAQGTFCGGHGVTGGDP